MRVMICGRVNHAWADGTQHEKREVFWPAFIQLHKRWKDLGAQLLGTIDDSYVVGAPSTRPFNFYEIYEVPDLATVTKMLDIVRKSDGEEVNIYKYLRFEAILGSAISAGEAFWNEESGD